MTHNVDCTVREEWREEIDRIGKLIWNDERAKAKEELEQMGWEEIGAGAGRSVWRVPTSQQAEIDDDVSTPVRDSPCVVKFATSGHHHNGRKQNGLERNQYEELPDRAKNADPPVFVPVMDHGRRDYWLTMPEVDPSGGYGVEERLFEIGMECHDLHGDNIGTMHSEPVVLDYGLDCREAEPALDLAQSVKMDLQGSEWVDNVDHDGDKDSAHVSFYTPDWIGTRDEGVQTASTVSVDRNFGIRGLSVTFGSWDADAGESLAEPAEVVADRINEDYYDAVVEKRMKPQDDLLEIQYDVEVRSHGMEDRWPARRVKKFYEDLVEWVEDVFEGARNPPEYVMEIAHAFDDMDVTEYERNSTERTGVYKFWPSKNAPGFERPPTPSFVRVDVSGFGEMLYTIGPYRDDQPHFPPINDAADDVIDTVQDGYPAMDVTWEKQLAGQDGTAVTFIVSSDAERPESQELDAGEIKNLYINVATEAQKEMPSAVPEGVDQTELDEYPLGEIEGAIEAAVADGGSAADGISGDIQGAISVGMVDDRAEQQAEGFAAAMYSHVHGDGEMGRQRVNVLVAQIADRLYDGPGEITTNHDASQAILVVGGDDIRHWDFWIGVEAAAENAPSDREQFIEQVAQTVLGSVEEVLRESEDAT